MLVVARARMSAIRFQKELTRQLPEHCKAAFPSISGQSKLSSLVLKSLQEFVESMHKRGRRETDVGNFLSALLNAIVPKEAATDRKLQKELAKLMQVRLSDVEAAAMTRVGWHCIHGGPPCAAH